MQYALIIYVPQGLPEPYPEALREAELAAHRGLQQDSKECGQFHAAVQLSEAANARTVRRRPRGVKVTDGPFAETKEVLAGFYLIDCDSIEEAIAYAERIPTFEAGSVEVRPVSYRELEV